MIWHTDFDKMHRCPLRPYECDGYVSSEETGWYFKQFYVYHCGTCGLKVWRVPFWPHHPRSGWTYRWRAYWTLWHGPWLRMSYFYWPGFRRRCMRKAARLIRRGLG